MVDKLLKLYFGELLSRNESLKWQLLIFELHDLVFHDLWVAEFVRNFWTNWCKEIVIIVVQCVRSGMYLALKFEDWCYIIFLKINRRKHDEIMTIGSLQMLRHHQTLNFIEYTSLWWCVQTDPNTNSHSTDDSFVPFHSLIVKQRLKITRHICWRNKKQKRRALLWRF